MGAVGVGVSFVSPESWLAASSPRSNTEWGAEIICLWGTFPFSAQLFFRKLHLFGRRLGSPGRVTRVHPTHLGCVFQIGRLILTCCLLRAAFLPAVRNKASSLPPCHSCLLILLYCHYSTSCSLIHFMLIPSFIFCLLLECKLNEGKSFVFASISPVDRTGLGVETERRVSIWVGEWVSGHATLP